MCVCVKLCVNVCASAVWRCESAESVVERRGVERSGEGWSGEERSGHEWNGVEGVERTRGEEWRGVEMEKRVAWEVQPALHPHNLPRPFQF